MTCTLFKTLHSALTLSRWKQALTKHSSKKNQKEDFAALVFSIYLEIVQN